MRSYDSPYSEFARSGRHMLYADDSPAGVSDSSIAMTASVTVPENAFLHFAHAFGFDEPNYDGGIVEYSSDEGATWVDAGSLFDHGGYTGAIAGGGFCRLEACGPGMARCLGESADRGLPARINIRRNRSAG